MAIPEAIRNIKLPDNFIEDLDAIEHFYDLFLEDHLPLDMIDEESSDKAGDNAPQANNSGERGQF